MPDSDIQDTVMVPCDGAGLPGINQRNERASGTGFSGKQLVRIWIHHASQLWVRTSPPNKSVKDVVCYLRYGQQRYKKTTPVDRTPRRPEQPGTLMPDTRVPE